MKRFLILAIGLTTSFAGAAPIPGHSGDSRQHHHQNPPEPPKKPTRPPVHGHPVRPIHQPTRPPFSHPTLPPVLTLNDGYRPPSKSGNWRPRPGQVVIIPNHDWRPTNHRFHNTTFIAFNIWSPGQFGYGAQTLNWNPNGWQYWVDGTAVELVVRSERLSNAMRASFERQASRNGLRDDRDGQETWDRVQRLDEALERVRAGLGYVSRDDLQESVGEALSRAQDVSDALYQSPRTRRMIADEWEDLLFEMNEMARYFDQTAIR